MTYDKLKRRVFEIIQSGNQGDAASRAFEISLIVLILVNVCLVIADTFTLPSSVQAVSSHVEVVSVIIFTIEYMLRIWTADLLYPDKAWLSGKLRYIFSFMAMIDLLAILPFYLPFIFPIDLRVLRMLRIIRLLRVFKINRYTNALSSIAKVFKRKQSELLSSIFVVLLLMIVASVLMFSIENKAQPDNFRNAFDALWWAFATLTTVGYGDIYPVTVLGKILSSIIAILGIGLVAVPTGIISAGFMENMSKSTEDEKKEQTDIAEIKYCPYCGRRLVEYEQSNHAK